MKTFSYTVRTEREIGKNGRFWAACGTDSLYAQLFTESGRALLERMEKYGTCRYLRNHHTLSALSKDGYPDAGGNAYSEDAQGRPVYHFEKINSIFREYLKYGIKPVVELDFLPTELSVQTEVGGTEEGIHRNRFYPNDWGKWHDLLAAFMENLKNTFGVEELRTWYFEVWNEPDGWPVKDWPQFYRMYDIFADVVTRTDEKLRIGGPGTYRESFLRGFLDHVVNGINYVTGKRGSRIDFISHHIYGMSGGWLEEYPLIMPSVQRFNQELMWLSRLIGGYPELKNVEFHLNEWGVCSHYEKKAGDYPALEIRNSEYSACFFVKLVDCIRQIGMRYGFEVSLMLYWGFCLEDNRNEIFAGNRDLMTAGHIPKPVLTAFEMMAMLGKKLLKIEGAETGGPLGCIAARSGEATRLMLYFFDENQWWEQSVMGSIRLVGLRDGEYRIRKLRLDREKHNTYRTWQKMGAPVQLDAKQREELLEAGEHEWEEWGKAAVQSGMMEIEETLAPQSIVMIEIREEKNGA